MRVKRRDLSVIVGELRTALKRETASIVEIGALLIEAKRQVGQHGKWLPWLQRELGTLSERTVQQYMRAARFAAKYESNAYLNNLSPSALYALSGGSVPAGAFGELRRADKMFTPEVIAAIFAEAEEKRVGLDRAIEIAEAHDAPPDEEQADASPDEERVDEQAEADEGAEAILDGPPPDLPSPPLKPPPSPPFKSDSLSPDALEGEFKAAVRALQPLATKPAVRFADTVAPDDLIRAADFLNAVANREPADPDEQGALRKRDNEIADLKERIAALEGEAEELKADNERLRGDLAGAPKPMPKGMSASVRRKYHLDAAAKRELDLKARIAELEAQIEQLKARPAESTGDLADAPSVAPADAEGNGISIEGET